MAHSGRGEKVLVTGAAGFLGAQVAHALLQAGYRVRAFDDLSTGDRDRVPDGAQLIVGDVTQRLEVAKAVDGVDVVVHLAGIHRVARSLTQPAHIDQINRLGTGVVVEAARRAGVRRAVVRSADAVYGQAAVLPTAEWTPSMPSSPYGRSMVAAEGYAFSGASVGLDTVSLRYFHVYGPGQPAVDDGNVVAHFVEQVLAGQPVTLHGGGHQRRDFVFIDDAVGATVAAINAPEPLRGAALNVGSGRITSLVELLQAVGAAAGQTPLDPHLVPRRRPDIDVAQADLNRITAVLDWEPRTSLAEGLRRTVDAAQASHHERFPLFASLDR